MISQASQGLSRNPSGLALTTRNTQHYKRILTTDIMKKKASPTISPLLSEKKQLNALHKELRSKHLEFVSFLLNSEHGYKKKNLERSLSVHADPKDNIKLLTRKQESILEPRVSLNPEFLAFTFTLEGCPRKLLNYVLFYEMEMRTGAFRFNSQVVDNFRSFCELFDESYQAGVIKQAMQTLVEKNIALNIKRGHYIINPMLTGGKKLEDRKRLVNEYSNLLRNKGCDTVFDFFPKYKKT